MARSTNIRKPTGPVAEVEEPMLPIEAPRRQRNRIGKKSIARAFAILAAKEDSTIEALLTEAVLDILQKYKQQIER